MKSILDSVVYRVHGVLDRSLVGLISQGFGCSFDSRKFLIHVGPINRLADWLRKHNTAEVVFVLEWRELAYNRTDGYLRLSILEYDLLSG